MYIYFSLKMGCNCQFSLWLFPCHSNHSGCVMISMLASSTVDHGFKPRSAQTKYYKISICCFSAKHAALWRKSKDWLARNLSEWGNMFIRGLLFQWASTIKNPTKRVDLVQSGLHHHLIKIILFLPWYSWKIAELALNNNYSLTQ